MHLLRIWTRGGGLGGDAELDLESGGRRKWTLLADDASSLELLRMIALICGGLSWLERLSFPFGEMVAEGAGRATVEALLELHRPRDIAASAVHAVRGVGVAVDCTGGLSYLPRKRCGSLPGDASVGRLGLGRGNRRLLFLAYGPDFERGRGSSDLDFSDPWFRLERFRSLFEAGALLTSPVAFLTRLQYRVRKARPPAIVSFSRLCAVLADRLGVPTEPWALPDADLERLWRGLGWEQRGFLTPIVDAVRHVMDSSPHEAEPLRRPGVLVFHNLDSVCPPEVLSGFAAAVDELFPNMQVICSLSRGGMSVFPDEQRQALLPALENHVRPSRHRRTAAPSVSRRTVLLAQVDGSMPNLALMKLASHLARKRQPFALARPSQLMQPGVEMVYASCVFNSEASLRRTESMRRYYGDRLRLGGSGVDLSLRLPPGIELLPAAYSLYPELGDRGLGFLTRGCPGRCDFCVVPTKEGGVRQVAELDDLLEGTRRRKLILLDDNLLAFAGADALLEQMVSRRIAVNFNQTLDILRVTPHRAKLLRRIACKNVRFTRDCYHFSLNSCRALELVRERYSLFAFRPADNVEFICMYGYDTTLAEDVQRFRFLRSLPGAYVFVQEYRPIAQGSRPRTVDYFDDRADVLVDEVASICFTQNMKSMEKFYRWLSERYYHHFGKLHMKLVQTIFRYNQRDRYGAYVADHPARSPDVSNVG